MKQASKTKDVIKAYDMPKAMRAKTGVAVVVDGPCGPHSRAIVVSAEVRKGGVSVTAAIVRAVEDELKWAMRLISRMPGGTMAGIRSQLGGLVADEGERPLVVIPSAADISRAERLFFAVIDVVKDDFARRMVLSRASKISWKVIQTYDPKFRSRAQLDRIYRQAIGAIYFSGKVQLENK